MNSFQGFSWALLIFLCSGFGRVASAQIAAVAQGEVLSREGTVDFTRTKTNWVPAAAGQKLMVEDRLRTMALSRALLQMLELGRLRVNELTTLEVLPAQATGGKAMIDLKAGAIYFFARERPRELQVRTPHAIAASRGTEFLVTIEPGGRVVFTVFDGEVELSNPQGNLFLSSGEHGAAEAGQAPFKLAAIEAVNVVQWWLYYPGVLDLRELGLTDGERAALAAPIQRYEEGDLIGALESYPAGRIPQSDGEKVLHAGLLLSAGQVAEAEAEIGAAAGTGPARAILEVIRAVSLRAGTATNEPSGASGWLARSYSRQAEFDLEGARRAARRATEISPEFGFAWERVAELEFSFGRVDRSRAALTEALRLSPRNAQGWALEGFLAAALNELEDAEQAFSKAIEFDPALGNGWLGLGLIRMRQGRSEEGRSYLHTAAAMEPNRSLLRSYLAKGFDQTRSLTNAFKEAALAKTLDSEDPTPWLYSALLLRQELRFNEAVEEMERSVALNDNRRVYRSRLLLDEDRAVRSSSLATIYGNAGLGEVSAREAARAVAADYGNPSAHLFLAESFNALRDPTRFNLRIETAWFNELLLANILAPVGGGNLSQNISQQEYSRLFEGNRIGFSSFTEARSDEQIRQLASHFGRVGDFSYALDLDYQRNAGTRPNNDLDRLEWYTTVKQQVTPQDSVLLLFKYQEYHSGDNFQYFDPSAPGGIRPNFRFDEYQKPLAVGAYHHQWSPGSHTLFLGGRIENEQHFEDRGSTNLIASTTPAGTIGRVDGIPMDVRYRGDLEIYTSEMSHILQAERHQFVFGGRYQNGHFRTRDRLTVSDGVLPGIQQYFRNPASATESKDNFERATGYGYYTVEPVEGLFATTGLAYDRVVFPENHRQPPIFGGSTSRDGWQPKAAIVWSPREEISLRGAYSRSLGGVSFDESFRLEPTQLAGFSQSYRTIISESIAGSVGGPKYETIGGALDLKMRTRTYLGVQAEVLRSDVQREIGTFIFPHNVPAQPQSVFPSGTEEILDYREHSLTATINQLIGAEWSIGAQYRITRSELDVRLPEIPTAVYSGADRNEEAELQIASLMVLYNHPSGFFARLEGHWHDQVNRGYTPELPGDDFTQSNFFLGWRFRRQRGEVSVGVLNLEDSDYRLNPLNLYAELPRERTFVARLAINL